MRFGHDGERRVQSFDQTDINIWQIGINRFKYDAFYWLGELFVSQISCILAELLRYLRLKTADVLLEEDSEEALISPKSD